MELDWIDPENYNDDYEYTLEPYDRWYMVKAVNKMDSSLWGKESIMNITPNSINAAVRTLNSSMEQLRLGKLVRAAGTVTLTRRESANTEHFE